MTSSGGPRPPATHTAVAHDGCRLQCTVEGAAGAPPLLLIHSLGTTSTLWDSQLARWRQSCRVIRFDIRGHGGSDAPGGDYTLDTMGHDALRVLDEVGVPHAHVCGVSIGGLVALWLGIHAPDRVGRLVAANTAARLGSAALWQERIRTVRRDGLEAIADTTLSRWFTDRFREQHPTTVARFRRMLTGGSVDGYAGCCAVLRDADLRGVLHRITAATLVVTGAQDQATSPADGHVICQNVAGARHLSLEAAHLANVEQAEPFSSNVMSFLQGGQR